MRDVFEMIVNDHTAQYRLLNKIYYDVDCWLWNGCIDKRGYGRIKIGGKKGRAVEAHIVSYTIFKGRISSGLELDHLCRIRSCVNPEHLEPVTHQQNMLRGFHATKTHCKHGHQYTIENTIYNNAGRRECKVCVKLRRKRLFV